MIKIAFVITGLEVGGAETMLVKLLSLMDRSTFEPTVITLRSDGALAKQVRGLDVPLHELGMSGPMGIPGAFRKLKQLGADLQPDIVQGWMYHGNLAAMVMHRAAKPESILQWSIRVAADSGTHAKPLTRSVIRLGARYSKRPRKIIYNSVEAANQHAAIGFSDKGREVIPNGFDTQLFAPSQSNRVAARQLFGIPVEAPVVGIVGRYHPMKDHAGFVQAASKVVTKIPECYFLFIGKGLDTANADLTKRIDQAGLRTRSILAGCHEELHLLYPAMDVHVSSSLSEGFPNVLGEAMSCGVACVATDVGDSGLVLGDTGVVVPRAQPEKLASGIVSLLTEEPSERAARSQRCRQRVIDLFGLPSVVAKYEDLFRQAVGQEGSSLEAESERQPVLAGEKSN